MGPGATYAAITSLAGVLMLLGWLYATVENPRSPVILGKSFLLFAVPIMLAPSELFQFPLGMWALVACEEGLKILGATWERKRTDKFWLVALFGVWELTVDKPFLGLAIAQSGEKWDRFTIIGLVYVAVLPVLMHAVTAAIYAFTFERRIWAAFMVSWLVHTAFNVVVTYFYLSPLAVVVETVMLGAILIFIIQRAPKAPATEQG